MQRIIKFRAWTGKQMMYQEKQYLASFIRRIVPQIILDHGDEAFSQHESYLPNGGVIDEYLMQFTGLQDSAGKDIYEGDIVEWSIWPYEDDKEKRIRDHVIFGNGAFATKRRSQLLFSVDATRRLEVIGNIYEHPALLHK